QSSANTIRSTWTRPRSSSEISVTLALWLRKLEHVIPRARPSGGGVPQPPRSAASWRARSDRELVDRRLARELGVRVADRSPYHRRDAGLEVRRLELEVLERIRGVG